MLTSASSALFIPMQTDHEIAVSALAFPAALKFVRRGFSNRILMAPWGELLMNFFPLPGVPPRWENTTAKEQVRIRKEVAMSVTDEVLKANEAYARNFNLGHLSLPPARKLAVVACMDARLIVSQILGLKAGDAHIIRNAGGIVTEDALRSLIISHQLLGTQEFIIINHTDCGMLTFKDGDLRSTLQKQSGTAAVAPAAFHAFSNLEENVHQQIQKVRSHPWVPKHVSVRGFVYDVKTGRLQEVAEAHAASSWSA
jgi:carbonic anhydrase